LIFLLHALFLNRQVISFHLIESADDDTYYDYNT
jgi:hypothetical protein